MRDVTRTTYSSTALENWDPFNARTTFAQTLTIGVFSDFKSPGHAIVILDINAKAKKITISDPNFPNILPSIDYVETTHDGKRTISILLNGRQQTLYGSIQLELLVKPDNW